jgi:hypothetical protein
LGLISYYDVTNGNLKVAHCSNLACTSATSSTVSSSGDVGQWTSIATSPDGRGLVSYYDVTSGDLEFARCTNATCSSAIVSTVDSAGDVGASTSMTVGSDGLGLISYQDVTNADLKLAHCSDANCSRATISTLDAGSTVPLRFAGQYTSIAVSPAGLALISYATRTLNVFPPSTTYRLSVATNVAANTLTGANVANGSLTGSNLASGTVTGDNLASGTVTRDNLAAGGCPSNSRRYGIWCVDDTVHAAISSHNTAMQTCHNAGKTLCPLTALQMCDIVEAGGDCAALTDAAAEELWTSDVYFGASIYADVIDNNLVYGGNNKFFIAPEDDAPFTHKFFCCQLAL